MPTYAPVWQIFPTPLGGKTHISNSDRLADDVGVGLAGRLLSASDWQAFSTVPSPQRRSFLTHLALLPDAQGSKLAKSHDDGVQPRAPRKGVLKPG